MMAIEARRTDRAQFEKVKQILEGRSSNGSNGRGGE